MSAEKFSLPPCGEGSGMGVSARRLPHWRFSASTFDTQFAPPPLTPPRKGEGNCVRGMMGGTL